jgi:hypothetical protein
MISRPLKWVSLPDERTSEIRRSEEIEESSEHHLYKEACIGVWTLLPGSDNNKGFRV